VGATGASTAEATDKCGSTNAVVFVKATRLLAAAEVESAPLLNHITNGRANVHWNRLLSVTSIIAGKDEMPARSKPTQVPTQRNAAPPDTTIFVAFGLEPRAAPTNGQPAAVGAAAAVPPMTSVTVAPLIEIATPTSRPGTNEPVAQPTPRTNFVEFAVAAV
jgi:hypothetical protein